MGPATESTAMIDWDKPIQTRPGRKARVLDRNLAHRKDCVAVAITECNGRETVECYNPDGLWIAGLETSFDIVNAKPST